MNDENLQFDGTRVDLGDDLLEGTEVPAISATTGIQDKFESARILMNEGLLEEAKKQLHQILARDASHSEAKKLLEEIREGELRGHLQGEVRGGLERLDSGEASADPDEIIRKLDDDFGVGLFPELSEDRSVMDQFIRDLERELRDASIRDFIDVGIGFVEMGLYEVAIHQFQAALLRQEAHGDIKIQLYSLWAQALISANRPLDATLCLQPVVRDAEIREGEKLELFYLLGLAHERLGQTETARHWFAKVHEIDPSYREFSLNKRK